MNGSIKKWNDKKRFGFLQSKTGEEFFFHISSFRNRGSRPSIGMEVNFEPGTDSQGRRRAEKVRVCGSDKAHPAIKASIFSATFIAVVAALSRLGYIPAAILWLYLGASVWLFFLYYIDKSAAENGRRRTPEATLHNFALIGGWPGALVAQQMLRHKSKKESFRSTFWITVILNVSAFAYLLSPYGNWLTNEMIWIIK